MTGVPPLDPGDPYFVSDEAQKESNMVHECRLDARFESIGRQACPAELSSS